MPDWSGVDWVGFVSQQHFKGPPLLFFMSESIFMISLRIVVSPMVIKMINFCASLRVKNLALTFLIS